MTSERTRLYFIVDGDRVGDRLELMLLDDDLVGAAHFSAAITEAIEAMAVAIAVQGGTVVFKGGDEVFGFIGSTETLQDVQEIFYKRTGCGLSIGLGDTPQAALHHLRRAKLLGGNRVVGERPVGR
ncbi:hypothetical protein [Melittangium boletus]|uniref:hypothetical protein n=1 Tax=Melittangium boletus TaxID=83453 RepID=UPI003DA2BEC2